MLEKIGQSMEIKDINEDLPYSHLNLLYARENNRDILLI